MAYDYRFGPFAQTPEQRANVLRQLQTVYPKLKTQASAYAQQLYSRYISGELSWADVRRTLDEMAAGQRPAQPGQQFSFT